MPVPVPYHEFARKCARLGIAVREGKGSHKVLSKTIDGVTVIYPVPVHKGQVKPCYIHRVLRTFRLTRALWDAE